MAAAASSSIYGKVFKKKLADIVKVGVGGGLCFCGINVYFKNDKFYDDWVMPIFHRMEPETAHNMALTAAKYNLVPKSKLQESKLLEIKVCGLHFKTPIGLAAGFDKNGEGVSGMFRMGFGFVEVGSVTPQPQPGNPRPRVFRLKEDEAIINRYGFNNDGHEVVYKRLSKHPPPGERIGILGVNLGKNKTSKDAIADYVRGVRKFGNIADYLVINVSSPNTPGLRNLQQKDELDQLLEAVVGARNSLPGAKPPIFLKIAPDLTQEDKAAIAFVVMKKVRVDGLIVSNTTLSRPDHLQSPHKVETGGLSGAPVRSLATQTVKDMYTLTEGSLPIIGVGGVSSGADAYEKIRAGASLVQLYSALVYHGPPVVQRIIVELEELLRKDGFDSLAAAVGIDCKNLSRTQRVC